MVLPSYDEIELLHKKYAPNDAVFENVFTHCQIVWNIAEQLIDKNELQVDKDLVKIGCLVHDIGVYALFSKEGEMQASDYIRHGQRGEEILRENEYPEIICRFASRHTGVGITLDGQDYEAETPEEKLVMYADKFHSKSIPPHFNSYEWYKNYVAQFGDDKVEKFVTFSEEFGTPNLKKLSKKYHHQIRD